MQKIPKGEQLCGTLRLRQQCLIKYSPVQILCREMGTPTNVLKGTLVNLKKKKKKAEFLHWCSICVDGAVNI